jgi:hypothetical protein
MAEDVDSIFTSHTDIWEGLKSYYYKFRSVPDVSILVEKFPDFDPVDTKGETGYYLEQVRNQSVPPRFVMFC